MFKIDIVERKFLCLQLVQLEFIKTRLTGPVPVAPKLMVTLARVLLAVPHRGCAVSCEFIHSPVPSFKLGLV